MVGGNWPGANVERALTLSKLAELVPCRDNPLQLLKIKNPRMMILRRTIGQT
jgi:hypothetical protein